MAVRKPIVLVNGQLEQLQPGDRLDIGNSKPRTNNNAGAIVIGQVVYSIGAAAVDLAQADAQSTIRVAGLVADTSIAAAASGEILFDGILVATTTQWDAVTGQTGGLTFGADYFLSAATAGGLVTTAPTTGFVVRVGYALSATEFEIEIGQPIKL